MQRMTLPIFRLLAVTAAFAICCRPMAGQQTLGGLTGVVTDASGALVPNATVTAVDENTSLTRATRSNASGEYSLVNLPIGSYTVTYVADGFDTQKTPHIVVQADRTGTLNAQLRVAAARSETVEVDGTPLMNAVDTTNGYVMDKAQIEEVPLSTGSFTGLATQSAGVNAELPSGTGANSGLGNEPIWANGQRDTSNSFLLNGVDASNLFNGKSTSQVSSARVINSTGAQTSPGGGGGVINSVASIYLTIGNAIPTPAPETISEVRVNASMYDAQQGSTSGAHIDLSTASGTNTWHGQAYAHRGTNWLNAAPFFFNQDPDVPANAKVPQLHRYILGGTAGGPLIKDRLFAFVSYQHLHVSDQEIGDSFLDVPVGLTDDRSADGLAAVSNNSFGAETYLNNNITAAQIDPLALTLFNSPALPGEPGKWLIPNDGLNGAAPTVAHLDNAFLPGTGRFKADLAVADLDFNASAKDTIAAKYFYQHDPTIAPYGYSSVPGFTEHLDSGAQVVSLTNTFIVKSNLSTTETLGVLREKNWGDNEQAFGPSAIPGGSAGTGAIDTFGSNYFPGVSIYNVLGQNQPSGVSNVYLNIGPNAEGQSANTGAFQNRLAPSGNAIWILGKHTLGFGASYTYTQLNTIDKRTGTGTVATDDFSQFLQGYVTPGDSSTGFYVTSFLQGDANRYYRSNQLGTYLQDKWQITPTLSLSAGVRYDWDGGLTEKYGRIFNFDPSSNPSACTTSTRDPNQYSYCPGSDTLLNSGLIIAGNNANGTRGVSNTTLTGRQWGIAPRAGMAWQPGFGHGKLVVRAGGGFYYDRGELFSYFSPGYAIGTVTGGPFGVNQQLPFVNVTQCPGASLGFYQGYIPTCGGGGAGSLDASVGEEQLGDLEAPWGLMEAAPPTGKASDLANYLPNAAGILAGGQPISLGVYDRANKLPYTMNYALDLQWQPRTDLLFELGYVGNLGRHQVIPVPFNQALIASPSSPTLAGGPNIQKYSYGYNVGGATLPDGTSYLANYEGGNVDLRVPYIGYAAESIKYLAAGVDAYNAMQAHLEKRLSHGIQVGASYTYSHALDEQSGLGLFYNGNNPLNLRESYGSSDFDRTHVIDFSYVYKVPAFAKQNSAAFKVFGGWSLVGLTVLQSGQPYSVIDFSGAVGSIYYSTSDGITNPIVPLASGCTAKSALTGKSGAFYGPSGENPAELALKPQCFTLPILPAGGLGGAIPASDPYETGFTNGQRNIFRQAFQRRADASLVKEMALKEKYNFKYTFDVYNLTNTASFDVPGNEVSQNQNYNAFPSALPAGVSPLPTGCGAANPANTLSPGPGGLYYCPSGLGIVQHTIGAPRQIQMSLGFTF